MNINGNSYTTIWLEQPNDKIIVIDQRSLPYKIETLELASLDNAYFAIKDMAVRGAPLIGVVGAYGVVLAMRELSNSENWKELLIEKAEYLKNSRPTAINLAWAVDRTVALAMEQSVYMEAYKKVLAEAHIIRQEEIDNCQQIGLHGVKIIEAISKAKNGDTVNILTHCNAGWLACIDYGTATAPIYEAFNRGIKVHVWVDETRPRNQGARLTAFELGQHGVPHTLIADNTGGHLMQHGMVDMVIVGSDRTTINGDVANKIGTYLKALAAKDNNVPFYAAMPISTIDFTLEDGVKQIPIEERDENEVKYMEGLLDGKITQVLITDPSTPAANYGFDVTPARLVTGIITEKGIVKACREEIGKLRN